ncbi:hypothetical protein H257_06971 [Aphanomyces astaci]|uniref:Uncharacterized protein n=1 Tax=Aphanomyces astaci TaxID=112090 RepID=W4GL19_APHAT|nr:hypothetical protein H257_06971 [Aphanomyces astaci]ETV79734.1 hypothetical protein H257_06971 [Aphanomyces astaci]|eukprot:XP_009830670.1 hypothetical protein H257_06971 [Aphanomyces astaci]
MATTIHTEDDVAELLSEETWSLGGGGAGLQQSRRVPPTSGQQPTAKEQQVNADAAGPADAHLGVASQYNVMSATIALDSMSNNR